MKIFIRFIEIVVTSILGAIWIYLTKYIYNDLVLGTKLAKYLDIPTFPYYFASILLFVTMTCLIVLFLFAIISLLEEDLKDDQPFKW